MTTTPLPLRLLGNTGKAALLVLIVSAVGSAVAITAYLVTKMVGAWLVVAFLALALAIGVAVTLAERRG